MRITGRSGVPFAIGFCLVCSATGPSPEKVQAQEPSGSSRVLTARMLTGAIHSADNKPMEGVTVSARDATKTITTTVFTDDQGQYAFPPLDQGQYQVWAQ